MARQEQVFSYLINEGLISATEADRLRERHQEFAEMGLLVDGVLREKDFLEALSAIFDLPPAGYRQGLYIERDPLLRLDASLIEKYKVLPVRRRADEAIDLLVVEPLNPMARDILEKALGAPIRPYIWPRIRHVQARHFFLGQELPAWLRGYLKDHPVPLGYASTKHQDIHKILRSAESLGVTRWTPQDLREFLTTCFDRDTLLKVLLSYGEDWLSQRAILVMGRSGLQPYFVEEWPTLPRALHAVDALRKLLLPDGNRQAIQSLEDWTIDSPRSFGITKLFETLEADIPAQVVVIPIAIAGRTAMVLVGTPTDRQTSIHLAEISDSQNYDDLREMAQIVGEQLEEMIKLAKSGSLPPPAERIPPLPSPRHKVGLGFEESLVELSIARRQGERHRWEIVDISQVIDDEAPLSDVSDLSDLSESFEDSDSSDVSESFEDSESVDASDDRDMESAVADALIRGEFSSPREASSEPEELVSEPEELVSEPEELVSEPEELVFEPEEIAEANELGAQISHAESGIMDTGMTTFGMPALQMSSFGEEHSEASSAAEASELSWSSDGSLAAESSQSSESSESFASVESLASVESEASSSSVDEVFSGEDEAFSGEEAKSTVEESNEASFAKEVSSVEEVENREDDREDDDFPEADEASEAEGEAAKEENVERNERVERVEKEEGSEAPEISLEGGNLSIPHSAGGVPMAQIFRRPRSVREAIAARRGSGGITEASDEAAYVGKTVLGLGEVSLMPSASGERSEGIHSEASDVALAEVEVPARSSHEESSWLDELEEGAEPDDNLRPGGTVKMNAEVARTQTFNQLLEDMSEEVIQPTAGPNTIPVDALEEVPPSGPVAIDIEESLSLIDSRDRSIAQAAAEHLATAGATAVQGLMPLFPGRLFVDRYQYTVESMPPVEEHGPVLEALVRIGQPTLAVVERYLDDASLERRFYATYLLTQLPAQGHFGGLFERLFDKDAQTRQLAQNIIHTHRHFDGFQEKIIAPLRETLQSSEEEVRIEIAADNLRRFKDLASVPLMIEGMGNHPRRVIEKIHRALREITFQPLSAAPVDWRRWWEKEGEEPRWRWLIQAMNSPDEEIRMLANTEIEQLPGVELNYHPDQPAKLRIRAQGELTQFFESQQD